MLALSFSDWYEQNELQNRDCKQTATKQKEGKKDLTTPQ